MNLYFCMKTSMVKTVKQTQILLLQSKVKEEQTEESHGSKKYLEFRQKHWMSETLQTLK